MHAHRPGEDARRRLASEAVATLVADAMFALSTPSRVQILACLMGGPLAVLDIVAELGLRQSAVSHQLRVLREHALVRVQRDGRRRVYALADPQVLALLEHALSHVERDHVDGRARRRSSGEH